MGATAVMILFIVVICLISNFSVRAALKNHTEIKRPRIVWWTILGVALGYIFGIICNYAPFWCSVSIGAGLIIVGIFLITYGIKNIKKPAIAWGSVFFGMASWTILFILLGLLNGLSLTDTFH